MTTTGKRRSAWPTRFAVLLASFTLFGGLLVTGGEAASAANGVSNYTDPSINMPSAIAAGPDGALWFTNDSAPGSIERITTSGVVTNYSDSSITHSNGIAAGADGALWFTNSSGNSIGRITTAGVVTHYTGAGISSPFGIVKGSDGAMWFTNFSGNSIGRITTAGTVTNFPLAGISHPEGIAAGSDGALWFTDYLGNSIGRITTGGASTIYAEAGIAGPGSIVAGPEGALWFGNQDSHSIGRITTAGDVTNFVLPGIVVPEGIAAGSDGALWFANDACPFSCGSIGRMTTDGVLTNYFDPSMVQPAGITTGADGALWFTNRQGGGPGNGSIGRISTSATPAPPPAVSVSTPADGGYYAIGENATADYSCAPQPGGPPLMPGQECESTVMNGAPINTDSAGVRQFSVTATDEAGNVTTVHGTYTVVGPPVVTLSTPAPGGYYPLGQNAPASYSCAPQPLGPPVTSCAGTIPNGTPIDTSSPGVKQFSVTATDQAGHASTTNASYTVVGPPVVALSTPADHVYFVVGQNAPASYSCAPQPHGPPVTSCAGTIPNGTPIDTSSPGVKQFSVTATDQAGNASTTNANYTVVAPVSVSTELPPGGGSVTTDAGGGPTALAPVSTTVSSPNAGTLSVSQGAVTQDTPSGFTLLGMQMNIVAPPATANAPLTLVFDVDAAMLPAGETKDTISILKDEALLPDCLGATTLPEGVSACISGRDDAPSGGGDIRLTVISASASKWNIAVGSPTKPQLTISNTHVTEGNAGTKVMHLPVGLSPVSAVPVSVHYVTANGTATAGSDYTKASGTLTFTPGQVLALVPVVIKGDHVSEPNETFKVTLSSPSHATILTPVGTGTIVNDDLSAPTQPAASPGNGQATVTWSVPTTNGGAAITGYKVTPYVGTNALPTLSETFRAAARSGSMTNLSNGTAYRFKISAINTFGTGVPATSPAVIVGTPIAPTKVIAAAGKKKATLHWRAPTTTNGAAITAYIITPIKAGVAQAAVTFRSNATTQTLNGLTTGTSYNFKVAAKNAHGAGPASLASNAVKPT